MDNNKLVLNKPQAVWLAIANLSTNIMKQTGALIACNECCNIEENEFIKIAYDAISRQLLMDIDYAGGHLICSGLRQLPDFEIQTT